MCDATFLHRYKYEEHKDVKHFGKLPFKCKQCDFCCKSKEQLRKHKNRVHENNQDICTKCGKVFENLKTHMKEVHPENDDGGTCEHCGRYFQSHPKLMRHVHKNHSRKFQVCTICEKVFVGAQTQQLVDHFTAEHGIFCHRKNTYVCDICKIKVSTNVELSKHYRTVHQTLDDFQCSKCEHKEPTKALLSIHCIDVHAMDPLKDLKDKESEIVDEKTLKTFQAIQVKADTNTHACHLCGKKLASKVTLNNHMKQMHNTASHVKCDKCPKTFNYPSELKKHVLGVHTKAFKFPCSQCSYVSNFKGFLKTHIRKVHEGRHRHKCTICERPFEAPKMLQKHMLKEHDVIYKY